MKEKSISILIIFTFLIFFSSSKNISVSQINITSNYSYGDILNGTFILNLTNVSVNSVLKTNLGHSIPLREFLKNNGYQFSCERYNCTQIYTNSSNLFENVSLNLSKNEKAKLGLFLRGDNISSIERINLNLELNFNEQNETPLQIRIVNETFFEYFNQTDNFNAFISTGCFQPSSTFLYNKEISDSEYCEKITRVPKTKKILVGANFSNPSSRNSLIIMSVYKNLGNLIGKCNFTSINKKSCEISFEEPVEGDLFVCVSSVSASTNLFLAFQQRSNGCGYFSGNVVNGDYYIYLKTPLYASANNLNVFIEKNSQNNSILLSKVLLFLDKYYSKDCSRGCFIPLEIVSNSNQNLKIKEVATYYRDRTGITFNRELSKITTQEPRENFYGELVLSKANFKLDFSGERNIFIYFEDNEGEVLLLRKNISVTSIPIIIDVYPKKIPAGIPSLLIVDYYSKENISHFVWKWDNVTTETTTEGKITKVFDNISFYELNLRLFDKKGSSTEKTFYIETISPKDFINSSLREKKEGLFKIKEKIEKLGFSRTINQKIEEFFLLDDLEKKIGEIERNFYNALTDEDYLDVVSELRNVVIPYDIKIVERKKEPILVTHSEISSDLITLLEGRRESEDNLKKYISSFNINNQNDINNKEIFLINLKYKNETKNFLLVKVDVKSKKEAFLIIQNNSRILSSVNFETLGNFLKLPLRENQEISFEFITEYRNYPIIYLSPKSLKNLNIIGDKNEIDTTCNYNNICEKENGENEENCRSDCKPLIPLAVIIIAVFLIIIFLYSIIQIKLKRDYEEEMFGSKQNLNNLIEFIKTSKEKGLNDEEIINNLSNKWSREQVIYALKKSRGQLTRPYEIIPIEKIKHLLTKND